jgi:BlaI family transcriptional regulator, penicillinase repressor
MTTKKKARGPKPLEQLAPRERQIMDILFRRGRATAAEVHEEIGEPLSNSAVRGMLRLLVGKGYAALEEDGPRYVYFPAHRPEDVSKSALKHLVNTFFSSSPSSAIAALLETADTPLSDDDYKRLKKLLEQAHKAGDK